MGGISSPWFVVHFAGSFVRPVVALLVYQLSAIGVSLRISSRVSAQQQAVLGVFLFMVLAAILSRFADCQHAGLDPDADLRWYAISW